MSDDLHHDPAAAWYRDPTGHGEARYWNGVAWTDSVMRGGVMITVPIPIGQLTTPPVPGTEYVAPAPAQPAPVTIVTQSAPPPRRSSGAGAFIGLLVSAVLIVLAVLLLVNVFGGDDDPVEPPTTEQPAPPATAPPATAPPATEPPSSAPTSG